MTDFITEAELASYLQAPITAGAAALIINLVNGQVGDVVGTLSPIPMRVKAIALESAARGWRNPQAYSSVTVGIDDYDKTTRREGKALPVPGVYLTDDETAELLTFVGVKRRRVGSIQLNVPDVS